MKPWITLVGVFLFLSPALAQDRDSRVRNDRKTFGASKDWVYNDLAEGMRIAKASGKPLLVVIRCIPCEACQEFDDDVARRDPTIRDLLDEFVCVRIVQANVLDLTHFQHDFDLSFAAYLMGPDLTIYGRYGTRSRRPENEDVSLEGLRRAMEGALRIHRDRAAVQSSLEGKQARPVRYQTPRDYPNLSGRYGDRLDYEGQVAKSCLHCHQIRDAERLVYRAARQPIPDEVLFPYPDPDVLGLRLDPKQAATIARVTTGSFAHRAGLRPGDELVAVGGQPLLSIADLQWMLHNAPSPVKLSAQVRRGDRPVDVTLDLPAGWRRGDISWRATTWDLRRMALGGMKLTDLDDEHRRQAGLPADTMALSVDHLGEYGSHAVAKRAGIRRGDIIVSFDGRSGRLSESEVLANALRERRPGDEVAVTVLRDGVRQELKFAQQ